MIRWATHPGMCLNVNGGINGAETNIQLWNRLQEHESMLFLMSPIPWAKDPTKCLFVAGGSSSNGANLQIYSCRSMETRRYRWHCARHQHSGVGLPSRW